MKNILTLCLSVLLCGMLFGQTKNTISGKVINGKKSPISGVNILVKGTEIGTSTDENGKFQLNLTKGKYTLLFSGVGYSKKELKINTKKEKNFSIILTEKAVYLDEVLVKGSKNNRSLTEAKIAHKKIAGGTNVVSMADLNSKRSATLKDALQMQPGVMIQEFFGANDQPRLNIRGSGIQSNPQRRGINLMQDGISMNMADGSYIIGLLEPRAANHIEVFRGANALKYGATTLGGAINLVSKNGYTANSPLEIHLEGGSFGYMGGSISSGFVKGNTDGYASISYNKTDGFRENNTSSRLNATFNIGEKVNEKFETRLYGTYTDLQFDIPGPLNQMQIDKDPKKVSLGFTPKLGSVGPNVKFDKPGRAAKVLRFANKNTYKFNEKSQLEMGIYVQYGDDTFTYPIAVGIKNTISHDLGGYLSFSNKTEKNQLSLGVNGSWGQMDRKYFVNIKGEKGKLYADNDMKASNLIFYGEDIYKLTPKFSVIASAQASWNQRNNEDQFLTPTKRSTFFVMNPMTKKKMVYMDMAKVAKMMAKKQGAKTAELPRNTSLDQSYFGFNPKLGFIYDIEKNNQLFANISRSYEPPTFDEIFEQKGGTPIKSPHNVRSNKLEAQMGTTIEFGSRGAAFDSRLHWDISLYHSWIKNEIFTITDLFGISGTTLNSPDPTIHQGVELGLNAVLFERIFTQKDAVNFNMVYNFSNFYFQKGTYKDKQIAGVPKHYIAAALEYKNPMGIFLNFNTEWLPEKTPTDHQNTVFQKAYQLFGFRTGYTKDKWGIFVEGKNIFNTKYASSYLIRDVVANPKPPMITNKNVTTFIPGVGANFSAGIFYKF